MKKQINFIIVAVSILIFSCDCFSESGDIGSATSKQQSKAMSPFATNDIKKIFNQSKILHEGDYLAHQGKYDEAITKFNEAMNPIYLNNEHDKSEAQARIVWAYKRQGKFELALKEQAEWLYTKYPKHEQTINEHMELLALVKSVETKDSKPIEDHINFLKHKYVKQLPPNNYVPGFSDFIINDIIHLYDYTHNYDAGIAFMKETIKYFIKNGSLNNRGGKKDIDDYTKVMRAWELDKQTGQHGHLQEVIKTSDIISW